MSINIRQKGQEGEREIQRVLEPIVRKVMSEGGYALPAKPIIQRNQNQSAVGGVICPTPLACALKLNVKKLCPSIHGGSSAKPLPTKTRNTLFFCTARTVRNGDA